MKFKRFIVLSLIILFSNLSAIAIEDFKIEPDMEVVDLENILETEMVPESGVLPQENYDPTKEKTLAEKLRDVYHLEVEQIDKPVYLLDSVLTHHCKEDSAWEKFHLWTGYNGDIGMYFNSDDSIRNQYDFNAINTAIDGTLKNNNGDFRVMLNFSPLSSRNFAQNLFADVYVATNKIPHHRVMVGNFRPPAGVEGAASPFFMPFLARSQISRTFGGVRKLGARVTGNYSLVDYDLGLYSSDTYFQEFFPGAEFVGWVNVKPLGKTDGKYGKLTIGGGLQGGHRDNNYCVTGANIRYDYKRFFTNFEWAYANGYNGPQDHSSDKKATGFYTTVGYRITPKLQALFRYDQFDPDQSKGSDIKREYSVGLNYFIKGHGLKLMLDYVFCQNEATKDSHKILLGTQILL